MTVSNNKTTYLISSQVPQFVRDDHETFVTFLEDYYKFLAEEGEVEYVSKNFTNYLNIDIIKEHIDLEHSNPQDYNDYHVFLQKIYDNFIKLIPVKVLADKALILKHAKDFYRARGSEKSVRFLLRILLGKEVNEDFGFYYPKRDVLRASDGKWIVEKSVRVGDFKVNNVSNTIAYNNFVNKTIYGMTSNAFAIVESVETYYDAGQFVTELRLSNSYKSFANGEKIYCYFTEEGVDKFLTADLFSGIITSVSLANGGSGYVEGAYVPVEGGGGTGGQVIIAATTKGSLSSIVVLYGGAGFRSNDTILITGGGGSGAVANVLSVNTSGIFHSNSYNIISSLISLEAYTAIGNTKYSNLKSSITDPANNWITNSMSTWTFANCGPIESCLVINSGNEYSTLPNTFAQGNNIVRTLGTLGRLEIANSGINYQVGDILQFINPPGSYGFGANATVTAVDGSGKITAVRFQSSGVETILGGLGYAGIGSTTGYNPELLPRVNVYTTTGSGANVIVKTLLGYGEQMFPSTSTIGTILSIKLLSGGVGYTSVPTLNLENMSTGTGAIATATVTTGAIEYPGRYINDDGHLSSYNFLEDRDYYQNYSYVVRIESSLKDYRKSLLELTHPAGARLFAQYLIPREDISIVANIETQSTNNKFYLSTFKIHTSDALLNGVYNVKTIAASYAPIIFANTNLTDGKYSIRSNLSATYTSRISEITVNTASHLLKTGDNVYLQFLNASANITNGFYTITGATPDLFTVTVKNGNTSFVVSSSNTSNLRANTGSGNTNNYIRLTQWYSNSNVIIKIGDSVNVGGNTVLVVNTSPNSNTIIVSPGLPGNIVSNTVNIISAPFSAFGNVRVYDPTITLTLYTSYVTNDNIYVKFNSNDTSLVNTTYTVLTANSSSLKIRHRDIVNAASFSGNVNVYSTSLTLTSNNHQLSNNESIYIYFISGDSVNATNGYYTTKSVTQNTFVITTGNTVLSNGLATLITSNVIINVASHGFRTNDSIYIWFKTGSKSNLTNGYYTANVLTNNLLSIKARTTPNSNGNITVYRNYMNVTINRTNHGFTVGKNVAIQLEIGDFANVANGIYVINSVANTDTYNILHSAITISSNISNILANSNGSVYVAGI